METERSSRVGVEFGVQPKRTNRLLGEILVEDGYLQPEDLRRLVQLQRHQPDGVREPIGRLAVEMGFLSETQLRNVLDLHGKRLSLGELLLTRGSITREDLLLALRQQREEGGLLGQILIERGILTEDELSEVLAEQSDLPYVSLVPDGINSGEFKRLVNALYAARNGVVPIGLVGRRLTVAIWHPEAMSKVEDLEQATGFRVKVVLASRSQVSQRIETLYGLSTDAVSSAHSYGKKPPAALQRTAADPAGGPFAELGLREDESRELERILRQEEEGVFLITGPASRALEETYLSLLRFAQGIDEASESPRELPEGLGNTRDTRAAERLFRTSEVKLRLAILPADHSVAVVQRLLDFGVHPERIVTGLIGVLAVCPVRRICAECAEPTEPRKLLLSEWFGDQPPLEDPHWMRGRGCQACGRDGYLGHFLLSELWIPSAEERGRIRERMSNRRLREEVLERVVSLGRRAVAQALKGETTLEEILKVVPADDVRQIRKAA